MVNVFFAPPMLTSWIVREDEVEWSRIYQAPQTPLLPSGAVAPSLPHPFPEAAQTRHAMPTYVLDSAGHAQGRRTCMKAYARTSM
jgi:hypothetical protein